MKICDPVPESDILECSNCPFCGSDELSFAPYCDEDGEWWAIQCDKCHATGPRDRHHVECQRAWDRRTINSDALHQHPE